MLRAVVSFGKRGRTEHCGLNIAASDVVTAGTAAYSFQPVVMRPLPLTSSQKRLKRIFRGSPHPKRRQSACVPESKSWVNDVGGSLRSGENNLPGDASTLYGRAIDVGQQLARGGGVGDDLATFI